MTLLEQILNNQKKQSRILEQIKKQLSSSKESSEWISAEEACGLTGYKKESLRKKGLTKNYKAGKAMYSIKELKERNLIN